MNFYVFLKFFHYNGRLLQTDGLLIVPDGETPPAFEKISLKTLYEMFKDTKSHGLASLQFLNVLNIFFGGDVDLYRDTITELYNNLSLEMFSGRQNISFEEISDLTVEISFKMKHAILSNLERKNDQD